jgi:hypothetical protein
MTRKGTSAWLVILLLAIAATVRANSLFTLFPGDGVPRGWSRRGEERLFSGSALYQHINGGAEMYHQHGFDRLAVQDYAKGDHEVRVEIYRMSETAGATAVFAEMTAGLVTQKQYGTACVLDEYQVLFFRGPYCVSLTTYESGAEPAAAMAALAARIDASLVGLAF